VSARENTMTKAISNRITELRDEAVVADDDDQASQCRLAADYELHDSDTAEVIEPEDMFPREQYPMSKYVAVICSSLNAGTDNVHVRIAGRRVYAA
jgi:hypothetical protein